MLRLHSVRKIELIENKQGNHGICSIVKKIHSEYAVYNTEYTILYTGYLFTLYTIYKYAILCFVLFVLYL